MLFYSILAKGFQTAAVLQHMM